MLKYLSFFYKVFLANIKELKHPYKIFLVVTKSCGSRCSNCHIWKEIPQNELTLPEYEKLAKNLGKSLSWLNISGGEPTDREDLIDIIQIFIKHCPRLLIINFTSNGLHPERLVKVADFLNSSHIPIIGINVSIDGPSEMHVKLRGGIDSYDNAIRSLKEIFQFKNLKIHASMTLFKSNSHLIHETYLSIKEHIPQFLKKNLHINYAFQSEHYYQNSKLKNYLPESWETPLPQSFFSRLNFIEFFKSIYQKKLLLFYAAGITPVSCSAMTSNVYISEHGELYTCTIWNQKIGSLRENGFNLENLLATKEALKAKEAIAKKDCPNCWSPCEAFPSLIDHIKESLS